MEQIWPILTIVGSFGALFAFYMRERSLRRESADWREFEAWKATRGDR